MDNLGINLLPKSAGVYLMKDGRGTIIYIGKAKNIFNRVHQYFKEENYVEGGWKTVGLVPLIRKIDFIICASERDALLLENKLIKKYQPFFNTLLKDDKTYPFIKLSVQEDYPRLTVTRKRVRDGALYFGPYPKGLMLRSVLDFLQKNKYAPLRPCKWSFSRQKPLAEKKAASCIYNHTRLCPAPCCGRISYGDYRAIVKRVRLFLEGDFKKFKKTVLADMRKASAALDYEQAAKLRDFANALEHFKERVEVSNYRQEKLAKSVQSGQKLKRLSEILGSSKIIRHIEAFDNSHLQGHQAVGAMVCFIDAQKYKAHYRRFKIKTPMPQRGADDFAMMREIVSRRLSQIKLLAPKRRPDLFVIDGGKGQLAFALEAIEASGLDIKVISLAKREEEFFVPNRQSSVKLDKSDAALRLLMEIRDEVHRFAITYHRLLRGKALLKKS